MSSNKLTMFDQLRGLNNFIYSDPLTTIKQPAKSKISTQDLEEMHMSKKEKKENEEEKKRKEAITIVKAKVSKKLKKFSEE